MSGFRDWVIEKMNEEREKKRRLNMDINNTKKMGEVLSEMSDFELLVRAAKSGKILLEASEMLEMFSRVITELPTDISETREAAANLGRCAALLREEVSFVGALAAVHLADKTPPAGVCSVSGCARISIGSMVVKNEMGETVSSNRLCEEHVRISKEGAEKRGIPTLICKCGDGEHHCADGFEVER